MMQVRSSSHPRCGFSLLELSIVLGIISLLVAFGITLGSGAIAAADRISTQDKLATIKEALDIYAKHNGYLPCPANRSSLPASGAFGVEARAGTTCTASGAGLVNVAGVFIGGVPVRNLGLSDNYASDSWSNKLTYAVSASHVGDVTSYNTQQGTILMMAGDRAGTHYEVTQQTNYASGALSNGASATYVVLSHGPDGRGAFPLNGTSVGQVCQGTGAPLPCNTVALATQCNDIENCDDSNATFYDTAYNDGDNPAQYFDDFIIWGSNALQHTPVIGVTTAYDGLCGAGACAAWCAPCTANYPSAAAAPPGGPALGNGKRCLKVIAPYAPCQATCYWAGTTSASAIVSCP